MLRHCFFCASFVGTIICHDLTVTLLWATSLAQREASTQIRFPSPGELNLGPRDCQSGALTTGPRNQACFGPVKLRTHSRRDSNPATLDWPTLIKTVTLQITLQIQIQNYNWHKYWYKFCSSTGTSFANAIHWH